MYLKFTKQEGNALNVLMVDGEKEIPFDYVEMINTIYKDKNIEDTIFEGDILQKEKDAISEMVNGLRDVIIAKDEVEAE